MDNRIGEDGCSPSFCEPGDSDFQGFHDDEYDYDMGCEDPWDEEIHDGEDIEDIKLHGSNKKGIERFHVGETIDVPAQYDECFDATFMRTVNGEQFHVVGSTKRHFPYAMNVEVIDRIEVTNQLSGTYLVFEDDEECHLAVRCTPELIEANK